MKNEIEKIYQRDGFKARLALSIDDEGEYDYRTATKRGRKPWQAVSAHSKAARFRILSHYFSKEELAAAKQALHEQMQPPYKR